MRRNFVVFTIVFAIAAIAMFVLATNLPLNWVFCGIGLPGIFGGVALVAQLKTHDTKEVEWVFAGFGAATGSAFALYVIPWILS